MNKYMVVSRYRKAGQKNKLLFANKFTENEA
jgi:hypothetical protein